ncbi:right-handed parallel beta-helix repeat-containing protein [Anaerosporobacter faecicola]|uniref:right-handed parallel beta-helix repeat-containing protein n=1 Tax=Anaerosporobacter faecicola TaxID=2718714 RepID=UPI00143B25EC|nr:right-handed parallel beta-helix repeat-containing protein [Anaerosporobacter faecicola]
MGNVYHVAKNGSNQNAGTKEQPFFTIQKAADQALPGDTVIVHEGEYREWVKPRNSGKGQCGRITYEAAQGEHVVIKGSECVTGWKQNEEGIWSVSVENEIFAGYNPYAIPIWGDWLVYPKKSQVHLGDVYLNGISLFEAGSLEELKQPQIRYTSECILAEKKEALLYPERSVYLWYAQVKEQETILYANFGTYDPNKELVEMNVRRSCFFPEHTGINNITVRGFEMAHAATPWAPPTADQPGMIGPHWSRGWIIEDNILHDSKCSAISLGKEISTGHNEFSKNRYKPGYQHQMEAVFLAKHIGWDKERIGSHIVRNNIIYDCGQNGIVGHLGCIYSEIYGNEIYQIAKKYEFLGYEIGGIKLHAAIDVQIHHNRIHHCSLGTWLDWQAQGTRVSCNVYDHNDRDLMVEVTHGPYLVDNNIFASEYNFENVAQGGAYVQNLCCGYMKRWAVPDRSTPYHLPHSTDLLGTAIVYGGDDRWYQNIFVGGDEKDRKYGTADYNGSPINMEEYVEAYYQVGEGDVENYAHIKQPVYIQGNVYLNGAKGFDREKDGYTEGIDPMVAVTTEGENTYLDITLPEQICDVATKRIGTSNLGMPRITETHYENPDGSPLTIDHDLLGEELQASPIPGPIQKLKPGKNHILIWKSRL